MSEQSNSAVAAKSPPDAASSSPGGAEFALFGATLFAWGTSWYALKINAGAAVAEEVSVFYRFVLAALVMAVWVGARRRGMGFPMAAHVRFAAMGATIFSFNFLCFYHAASVIPSGFLAVLFSLVSVMNPLVAAALAGTRPEPRVLFAATLGVSGIVAIFLPEIVGQTVDASVAGAVGLCLFGNCLFVTGNMISARVQRDGVPVIEANAIGMVWGAVWMAVFAVVRGIPLTFEWSASYVGSLVWLSVFSSVVAFAAYLTLLGRMGAGRAGYLTVMFPVVALLISTVLEDYRWTLPALGGLVLVLVGNAIVLKAPRGRRA